MDNKTGLVDTNGDMIFDKDYIYKEGKTKINVMIGKEVYSPYWKVAQVVWFDYGWHYQIIKQKNSYFGKLPSDPEPLTNSKNWTKCNVEMLKESKHQQQGENFTEIWFDD